MDKELENFIEKNYINENENLSNFLMEIMPAKETKFTDLEIEADKKYNFSLVVYKKQNPIISFFKKIKFGLESLRIMRYSREAVYIKNEDNYNLR